LSMTYPSSENKWQSGIHPQSGKKLGRMPRLFLTPFALSVASIWRGRIGLSTISSPQEREHPTMTLATYNRYVDNAMGARRIEHSSAQRGGPAVGEPVLYWAEDLKKTKRNKKNKTK